MASGSAMRPSPYKPLASSPLSTGIIRLPNDSSFCRLPWVAGWCHISSSMAGATTTGQVADNQVANNILSHKPLAILARVLQLKGATTITSAQRPSITWFDQDSLLTSSVMTEFFDNVARVSGDTNSLAAGVITTFTSAPAFTK